MSAESKTPRTDKAEEIECASYHDDTEGFAFARKLETELNTNTNHAVQSDQRYLKEHNEWVVERDPLKAKLTELRKIADGLAKYGECCHGWGFNKYCDRCKDLTAYEQWKKENAI